MSECCPGSFITPRDAVRVASNYVYSMYRDWAWSMYRVGLRVVRVYRYGCVYNVEVNVKLTPILAPLDNRRAIVRAHVVGVDPCTGGIVSIA